MPQLHAKSLAGDWTGMADLISDEALEHFAVTATWETLGQKLRERYDGICDHTQLYPSLQPSSTISASLPSSASTISPSRMVLEVSR